MQRRIRRPSLLLLKKLQFAADCGVQSEGIYVQRIGCVAVLTAAISLVQGCASKPICLGSCDSEELLFSNADSADILDFGRAYYYPRLNEKNNLYIEVESRTRTSSGMEYVLLASHPRESTFKDNGQIYSSVIQEDGASFIIFMMDTQGGQAIIERRYARAGQPEVYKRSCGPSPYGTMAVEPKRLTQFAKIADTPALRSAVAETTKLTAQITYKVDGVEVVTDFPVRVLNINPNPQAKTGQEWQIASSLLPVYVPEAGGCGSLRSGYVAFSGFSTILQFVYLCDADDEHDYACTVNRSGKVRIFASD